MNCEKAIQTLKICMKPRNVQIKCQTSYGQVTVPQTTKMKANIFDKFVHKSVACPCAIDSKHIVCNYPYFFRNPANDSNSEHEQRKPRRNFHHFQVVVLTANRKVTSITSSKFVNSEDNFGNVTREKERETKSHFYIVNQIKVWFLHLY